MGRPPGFQRNKSTISVDAPEEKKVTSGQGPRFVWTRPRQAQLEEDSDIAGLPAGDHTGRHAPIIGRPIRFLGQVQTGVVSVAFQNTGWEPVSGVTVTHGLFMPKGPLMAGSNTMDLCCVRSQKSFADRQRLVNSKKPACRSTPREQQLKGRRHQGALAMFYDTRPQDRIQQDQ